MGIPAALSVPGPDWALQCVSPHFVATKMSRMKPSFACPTPEAYAKAALATFGIQAHTFGCFAHSLIVRFAPTSSHPTLVSVVGRGHGAAARVAVGAPGEDDDGGADGEAGAGEGAGGQGPVIPHARCHIHSHLGFHPVPVSRQVKTNSSRFSRVSYLCPSAKFGKIGPAQREVTLQ